MTGSVAAWVAASRAAQGLPERVEDEETLLDVAGRLLAAQTQDTTKADRRSEKGAALSS